VDNLKVYYIVVLWFLFIALFNKEHRLLATILCIGSMLNIVFISLLSGVDGFSFNDFKIFLIKFDGTLSFLMLIIINRDKTAWRHALILAFAVTCHSMILLFLITKSPYIWELSEFFYDYYDELIITSALLQMVVSYNGLRGAAINADRLLQVLRYGPWFRGGGISSSLLIQKESKGKR